MLILHQLLEMEGGGGGGGKKPELSEAFSPLRRGNY